MKAILILCAVITCSYAASVPQFVPIANYHDSLVASLPQSRIANGHAAIANQFPHQCSMLAPVPGNFYLCGCSIISIAWVSTAAHCTVPHDQFNLRFGTLTLFTGGLTQTSFHSVIHPNYNPITLNFDISIVSVPVPLTLTPSITPIRLASLSQVGTSFANLQTAVSGWGATGPDSGVQNLLRWVYMRPITNAQCTAIFGEAVVIDAVICAEGFTNPENQGHCGGDSGGALVFLEDGVPTQIGSVAFAAAAGCHLGFPSGYVRMSHVINWIASQTGIPVRP